MCRKFFRSLFFSVSALLSIGSVSSIASADTIVLGSDYFHTVGAGVPGVSGSIPLISRPGGIDDIRPQYAPLPPVVDTIIERQQDCDVNLGGNCTIAIELVGLSLQNDNGSFWVREDPDRASSGSITIQYVDLTNGVASGTFDSIFDVFFEYSVDNGATWFNMEEDLPGVFPGIAPYQLGSRNSIWSSDPNGLLFPGLVGDLDANFHTNLIAGQFDFFADLINEANPAGAFHNVVLPTPIPGAVWLFGTGLIGLLSFNKKKRA